MPHWLIPANWTPEWVSAIAGVVAALGAVGAFTLAFILIRKQYSALDATTKALNDEMEWRHQERERQREEARERRAAQASKIHLKPQQPNLKRPQVTNDYSEVQAFIGRSGIPLVEVRGCFEVSNHSSEPVRDVKVTVEHADGPRCYVAKFEDRARPDPMPVLPAWESARFYWVGNVAELHVQVEFTDANGVRWRNHYRDGLSEVTGQE